MVTLDLPDVYTAEITPSGAPVKGVGTGKGSLVGKFKKGDVNKNVILNVSVIVPSAMITWIPAFGDAT